MATLYDLMGGPDGRAFDEFAARFGLSRAQIEAAAAALMPAYAEAMRRGFADPAAMAALAQAWRTNPQFGTSGSDAAAAMFGGPELREAVAEQAAQASGVSGAIMRELLPPLTAKLIAGVTAAFAAGLTGPVTGGTAGKDGIQDSWADYFARFMSAAGPAAAEAPKSADGDAKPAESRPGTENAAAMMALGREIAEQNARAMQTIVDAFLKPRGGSKG